MCKERIKRYGYVFERNVETNLKNGVQFTFKRLIILLVFLKKINAKTLI